MFSVIKPYYDRDIELVEAIYLHFQVLLTIIINNSIQGSVTNNQNISGRMILEFKRYVRRANTCMQTID